VRWCSNSTDQQQVRIITQLRRPDWIVLTGRGGGGGGAGPVEATGAAAT
jgi:hypothetical protein